MKLTKNIGILDRGIRCILAGVFLLLAVFWTYGIVQAVLYVLAFVLFFTALFRFCSLYTFFKVNTCPVNEKPKSKVAIGFSVAMFLVLVFVGSYYSLFFTKKSL